MKNEKYNDFLPMLERLTNADIKPDYEHAIQFIGTKTDLFNNIENFLIEEHNAEKEITYSSHDKCWGISYCVNLKPICIIYLERESIFVVIRFSLAKDNKKSFDNMYTLLSQYAKMCVDNSPWKHVGYVEYRVVGAEHLDDLKIMLNCRISQKYKKKPAK